MKRCASCVFFTEVVGYCSLHDKDVTRYSGCKKHDVARLLNKDKKENENRASGTSGSNLRLRVKEAWGAQECAEEPSHRE